MEQLLGHWFLEQQPAAFATLMSKEIRKTEEVNSDTERDIWNAEDIVKLMAPVKVVTTVTCEEEQPTISMISPLRAKRQKHFEAWDRWRCTSYNWDEKGLQ